MKAPATYQGGKSRLAKSIADCMNWADRDEFWDVCCGSGAMTLEAVKRGIFDPHEITMVDRGPWGLLWKSVGEGTFNLRRFKVLLLGIPEDPDKIRDYLKGLASEPTSVEDAPYIFLILQAGSFGGSAIDYRHDGTWDTGGFRSYWKPTATSKRRSPVNPMMPMPTTLHDRMSEIVQNMKGVRGIWGFADREFPVGCPLVYIDPPYAESSGYAHTLDLEDYLLKLRKTAADPRVYVSEGRPLPGTNWCLSKGQAKGGMNGRRRNAKAEWLTLCS